MWVVQFLTVAVCSICIGWAMSIRIDKSYLSKKKVATKIAITTSISYLIVIVAVLYSNLELPLTFLAAGIVAMSALQLRKLVQEISIIDSMDLEKNS